MSHPGWLTTRPTAAPTFAGAAMGDVVYRINDRDELILVAGEWDRFAAANAGPAVASDRVLHRPLWDFITDAATREIYRRILASVRGGRPLRFTFRCDSAERLRLFEMTVERREDGSVEFRTRTLSDERRSRTARPDPAVAVPEGPVRVCGWCKKICVDGVWGEVDEAVAKLWFFQPPRLREVTHGMCEQCYQSMAETVTDP